MRSIILNTNWTQIVLFFVNEIINTCGLLFVASQAVTTTALNSVNTSLFKCLIKQLTLLFPSLVISVSEKVPHCDTLMSIVGVLSSFLFCFLLSIMVRRKQDVCLSILLLLGSRQLSGSYCNHLSFHFQCGSMSFTGNGPTGSSVTVSLLDNMLSKFLLRLFPASTHLILNQSKITSHFPLIVLILNVSLLCRKQQSLTCPGLDWISINQ